MRQEDIKMLLKKKKLMNKPLVGCTEEEIMKLEEKVGLKLPETYKEFCLRLDMNQADYFKERLFIIVILLKFKNGPKNYWKRITTLLLYRIVH